MKKSEGTRVQGAELIQFLMTKKWVVSPVHSTPPPPRSCSLLKSSALPRPQGPNTKAFYIFVPS